MIELFFKSNGDSTSLEEVVDAATHAIGVLLSIVALIILLIYSSITDDPWKIVTCSIFGASLIFAYSSSTIYHLVREPKSKRIFKLLDHLSIYILIAGTYTPFTLIALRPNYGWHLFIAIWSLAIVGMILKIFFINRFQKLSIITYILMGWLAIVAINPIYQTLPLYGILWLLAGGLSYTLGVIFFAWNRLRFGHALWHICVLGGSFCHFIAILYYIVMPQNLI